jgi:hypothetical protein
MAMTEAIPTLEHGDLPRDVAALRVPATHNRISPLGDWGPLALAVLAALGQLPPV